MKILLTGAAGFIGFHTARALLKKKIQVIGIDNLNDYYSKDLKLLRLKKLEDMNTAKNFKFYNIDISNKQQLKECFEDNRIDIVLNFAAQAGVRYSINNPDVYVDSNLNGFMNILECCKLESIKHLLFASSSSVYGLNQKQPFSEDDRTDYPISLYAATKKSNEILAYSYSHLFNLPVTGLRFFTVYGEYGRPDMAYFKFTKAVLNGDAIDVYNHGKLRRDFTYIDDIVDGIMKLLENIPNKTKRADTLSEAPFRIFNLGNNNPITLERFISSIEKAYNKKAIKNYVEMQDGDVLSTYADIELSESSFDFCPKVDIDEGMKKFLVWYKKYSDKLEI